MKKLHIGLLALLSSLASLTQAVSLPGPVVSAEWLTANKAEVQILEVRGDVASFQRAPEFELNKKTGKQILVEVGGHIKDSSLLDFKKVRADRMIDGKKIKYLIPEKADFEKLIQSVGINANKPIILVPVGVDMSDIDEALRTYWQFKVYGEDNIAVLDGGMAGWLAEGREFTTAPANKAMGNWLAKDERKELIANSEQVAKASASGKTTLIDARQPVQFFGLSKRDYVGGYGHIAGAKDFAPELMAKPAKGALYFWDKNTYNSLLQANGISSTAPAISYCNSGHLASGGWFILSELVGNKSTSLYDGSLYLWTLEGRPLVGVSLN
jgi:thiosulfate/3-mercaptopyruvate sulfurtransferase